MQDELDANSDYESDTSEDEEEDDDDEDGVFPHSYFDFPGFELEEAEEDVFGGEESEHRSPQLIQNSTEAQRHWRQRFASN